MKSDNKLLISIITVVFNGAKTLEQTIQSVINQTYTNIEYIIIDGGSSDGSVEIIKKYQDHLSYWVSEHDKGIYDAMNKGIKQAKGDFIGIINSDDWYEKETVQNVVDEYLRDKRIHVFHGLQRYIRADGSLQCVTAASSSNLKRSMFEHSTCFVKKDVYLSIGGFNTKYKIAADYDLMLRILNSGYTFHLIEKVLSNLRLSGISESDDFFLLRWNEDINTRYQNKFINRKQFIVQKVLLIIRYIKMKLKIK